MFKKDKWLLYLDTTPSGNTRTWARIGKSTLHSLAMNAETETFDYIEDEIPTSVISRYQPSMDQEIHTYEDDPCYTYIEAMAQNLPVGDDAFTNFLYIFPRNIGTSEAPKFSAWLCKATITISSIEAVDHKISFNIAINSKEMVEVTVTNGIPTIVTT